MYLAHLGCMVPSHHFINEADTKRQSEGLEVTKQSGACPESSPGWTRPLTMPPRHHQPKDRHSARGTGPQVWQFLAALQANTRMPELTGRHSQDRGKCLSLK